MKRQFKWSRLGWLLVAAWVLFLGTAGAQDQTEDYQGCRPWAQGNLGNAFLNVLGKKLYDCKTAIDVVKNMQENRSQIAVFQELAYESLCRSRVGDYAGTTAWWNYCKLLGHWENDICCGCPSQVDDKTFKDNEILYGKNAYEVEKGAAWSYAQIPLLLCNPHNDWQVALPFEVFSQNAAYPNVLLACAKWEIVPGLTLQGGDIGYPEFDDSGFFAFWTVEPDGIKPDVIYSVYLPSDFSVGSKIPHPGEPPLKPAKVRKDFIDRFWERVASDPREWIAAGDWNFDPYYDCQAEDAKAFLNLLTIPRVGVCSDPNGGPCLMMDADGKRSSVCPLPWTAGLLGTLDLGVGNNHRYCTTGRGITHPRPTRGTDHDLVPHDCGYCGDGVCNQSNLDSARGPCEWWKNCCTDCPIPADQNPNCSRHCCVTNDPPCKPWSTKVIFCCPNTATSTPTNQTQTDPNSPNPCTDVCKCGCPPGTTQHVVDTNAPPGCAKAHDLP